MPVEGTTPFSTDTGELAATLNQLNGLEISGARIKNMRKKKGWSLRDMVKLHDYHDSQWRKFESGGSMNVMSLLRIAEVFEMSLSKLLDGLAEFPKASVTEITKKVATKAVTRTSAQPK